MQGTHCCKGVGGDSIPIAVLAKRLHHETAFAQKKMKIIACFSGDRGR